ncbi:MAG: hypothetical protein ACLU3I_11190 [Acutalibacteraceae bacterium]
MAGSRRRRRALSATLYQMITGVTPPGAIERGELSAAAQSAICCRPLRPNTTRPVTEGAGNGAPQRHGPAYAGPHAERRPNSFYEELTAQTPARRVRGERSASAAASAGPLWAKIAAGVLAAAIAAGGVLLYLNRAARSPTRRREDGSYVLSPER